MQYLKSYQLFENLDIETVVDNADNLYNMLIQLRSFDDIYVQMSNEDLFKLVDTDFDIFLKLLDVYIRLYEKTNNTQSFKLYLNNFFKVTLQQIATKSRATNNFLKLATFLSKYESMRDMRPLHNLANLDVSEIAHLIDLDILSYDVKNILNIFKNYSITLDDILQHKNNLTQYVNQLWKDSPRLLIYQPKILTQLAKKDTETLLNFVNALSKLVYQTGLEGIKHVVVRHLNATFSTVRLNYMNILGPYIYRSFLALFKANKIEEAIRLYYICKKTHSSYTIPFGPKDIEAVIPKDTIKYLLSIKAITLSKADRERILNAKDQYAIWTSAPSYKILIDKFDMRDITTSLIKRNGNLKLTNYDDSFTLYSYGVVRKSGATGITVEIEGAADTLEGAELLLQQFRMYLSRKIFQQLKKDDVYNTIKMYLKQEPIKSRTATAEEWNTWFKNLDEYYQQQQYYPAGRHLLPI